MIGLKMTKNLAIVHSVWSRMEVWKGKKKQKLGASQSFLQTIVVVHVVTHVGGENFFGTGLS